jgi:enoyl-CoA hydratase/carnithine racemase
MREHPNFAVSLDGTGAVSTVTIDRPDKRNALTVDMWDELAAICAELAALPDLRAVVVTGAGTSFCAGADISALLADDRTMKASVFAAEEALRRLPVPTVAKISGYCMGGGNQIAVACDLRIADTTAVFGIPPARLSVVYPPNSTKSLVELVGPAAAKRLIFTAAPVDAAEALRIGLVNEVVDPDALDGTVDRLVTSMLPLAPMTQVATKQLVNAIADATPAADIEALHARWYAEWEASADGVEGPKAFLDKRPPSFTWRANGSR